MNITSDHCYDNSMQSQSMISNYVAVRHIFKGHKHNKVGKYSK